MVANLIFSVVFLLFAVPCCISLDGCCSSCPSRCCRWQCWIHIFWSNLLFHIFWSNLLLMMSIPFVVLNCCDPFCCCALEMPIPDVARHAKELVVRCQWCKRILLSMRSMSSMNSAVGADPEIVIAKLLLQNFCCWTCCWDWCWPADWK